MLSRMMSLTTEPARWVFNVTNEPQAKPLNEGGTEETGVPPARPPPEDTSPSLLSSQDRVSGFSHDL